MGRILRLPKVIDALGKSRSTVYAEIRTGLLPTPVAIGARAVGFPESEITSVIHARIAGKSDQEIRELVTNLVARRSQAA